MTSMPMTPPFTPAKQQFGQLQQQLPDKGPYTLTCTPEGHTPLQKHCAYFDLDGDGILVPWHTYTAFRDLGYGLMMSMLGTLMVHFFFSYPTLDTWWPDPFFSIHLKNIQRCVHGSDSGTYNNFGETTTIPIQHYMARFDAENKSGLTFSQGWSMIKAFRDINDPFGWFAAVFEWGFLYILCADADRIVSFEAISGQYDGTLFYTLREQRRAMAHAHQQ